MLRTEWNEYHRRWYVMAGAYQLANGHTKRAAAYNLLGAVFSLLSQIEADELDEREAA